MIKPFYFEDNRFYILDQRQLPGDEVWMECSLADQVAEAIKTLAVRGAPAIGIAAAYGLVLAADSGRGAFEKAADILVKSRPTAVNLEWAVKRVLDAVCDNTGEDLPVLVRKEADKIWEEEIQANESMAQLGAGLFDEDARYSVLTHCNAGSLATGGIGTAVGVIRKLYEQGKLERVYMDETRPLLQGARITAYEMKADGIPATLITDNMAGWLMKLGRIDAVIVGADRIAKNLDAANKIGTYSLAVLANAHNIPFYIAAPKSTFDPNTPTGHEIVIEERDSREVLSFRDVTCAPAVSVCNPAFDVTPHNLITAIITEEKIYRPASP
jgi:methylthioribose-1-phosphate isomerase